MLSLSTQAIKEKNKRISDGAFILLLEIMHPSISESIRLCWNIEDITWNGEIWKAAPFELGDLNDTKESEVPSVDLTIIDIKRDLTPELDNYAGGVGAKVFIRIINSNLLDITTPLREEMFDIMEVSIDSKNRITFKLGAENLQEHRSPKHRFLKNHCRYKIFKGAYCGYDGPETECNRTFSRCKELGNQKRFGGAPGTGREGIWKT